MAWAQGRPDLARARWQAALVRYQEIGSGSVAMVRDLLRQLPPDPPAATAPV
ncbi:hypothetical protein KBX00_05355 [Micromonospora sp. C95]|nr:hypothetical protein [Micromonospora sp. C95]MBQ1023794.1 hypothetical protein [Micromonospora sp. C95]